MIELPRPGPDDPLSMTDVHLRRLAYAVDAQIGRAVRTSVLPEGAAVTTDGDGLALVEFPGLDRVSGAFVAAQGAPYVGGARTTYPPVPPASIGWTMPTTPAFVFVFATGSGGQVVVRVMTTSTNRGVHNGVVQQWGAQNAVAGSRVTVTGLAWGPA